MSLSAMPSDLARAINLPALPARTCCAAEALDSFASTPTHTTARSGFLDTRPLPLVITPGSNVVVVFEDAEGAISKTDGRLIASTASVAMIAQSVPMAAVNATVRKLDGNSCHSPIVQTPHRRLA